jgi:terminase small subunit / prophage DNA-packing protein
MGGSVGIADRPIPTCTGRLVSQDELAEICGVSRQAVLDWQAAGLPHRPRSAIGEANQYDTAEVITWLVRHEIAKASGGETAKDRLARVQADRIEIDIAERRSQLIDAKEAEDKLCAAVIATRVQLLQLPERLAGAMDHTASFEARRDILRDEIIAALVNLTHYDPRRQDDSDGVVEIRAAEAHDGGGMGRGAPAP